VVLECWFKVRYREFLYIVGERVPVAVVGKLSEFEVAVEVPPVDSVFTEPDERDVNPVSDRR